MIIILIAGLIMVDVLGVSIYSLFFPESKILEKISIGFIVGLGIFTFTLFLLNLLKIPYSSVWSNIILIVMGLVFIFLNSFLRKNRKRNIKKDSLQMTFKNLSKIEVFFIVCIFFLFLSSLVYTLYWPIKDWDTMVMYDFRALTFIKTGFMADGISRGYFFGYPLFTSLAHTWVYSLGWSNPYFIYSLLYIFFVIAFFCLLLRFMDRYLALLWTTLVAFPAEIYIQSTFAYTNLPYAIFFVLGCLFMILWEKLGERRYILMSAILMGLSSWARSSEPFWIIPLVIIIIFSFIHRKFLDSVFYIVTFFLIRQPWLSFERMNGGSGEVLLVIAPKLSTVFLSIPNLSHILKVIIYVWNSVFISQGYLLVAFISSTLIVLLLNKKLTKDILITISLVLASYIFIFLGTYILSLYAPYWEDITDSATRMSIMLIPLMIFGISLNSAAIFSSMNFNKNTKKYS